ncbi:phosphoenolpyruvate--protein phosphotransferase [Microbacterium sp. 179-I 3D4 NHS]|uniref:phosphoenolpyruvate--protein phosphotransferase n=1 Tax=Microbacterium sp. 179-I 3D4 NHS TaxID=3142381 RepID=UPI0039A3C1DE
MIGVVAVSHSTRLAEAALELARQMVRGADAPLRVAAGAGTDADGAPVLGTDAVAVAAAIDELAGEADGVLVLMDLGSAVLSAELALELRSSTVPVRLAPAPFVEGLLAAVVAAGAGGDLDTVAAEAAAALGAKTDQLSDDGPVTEEPVPTDGGAEGEGAPSEPDAVAVRVVRVRNPQGMHARPAAMIAEAAAGEEVRLRRLPDGPEAPSSSLMRLLTLGARQGDEIELSARGAQAEAALDRLVSLFDDGFGEGTDAAAEVLPTSETAPAPVPAGSPDSAVAPGTVLHGRGVSPGVAAATVVHLAPALPEPDAAVIVPPEQRDAEASTIRAASAVVADRLRARTDAASGEARDILDAARVLASDPELLSEATALVRTQGRTAARAVWEAAAAHEQALVALGGRMAERAVDVRDVRDRIVAEILGRELPGVPERDRPFVVVAVDLAPADTAALAGGACAALVTEHGGPTSHTAIIARSLGLPAVVGAAGATGIVEGETVLVDGDRGTVEVAPAVERVTAARAASAVVAFDGRGRLGDGHPLPLLANVGGPDDAEGAADAAAEGIGLFRTEFCFLGRTDAPGVDEQVAAYRGVLAPFAGRRVVVRTLDAGSDKPLPFANTAPEDNPALGVRGLRIARRAPALLDDQLRALSLAAAAESAVVEVMAPMVATVEEARDFAERARAAGLERVGIMIETPSAALLAAEMLEVVDFVSLGTNDLAQYTLAADRLLSDLGDLTDPWQPAVLRLIGAVGAAGRAAGRGVGVCGEAGGDPALAPVLVGLGATSLSMTARSLGRVAAALSTVSADDCRRAAEAASSAGTADEARAAASAVLDRASGG